MDFLQKIIAFMAEHGPAMTAGFTALIAFATVVVGLTKTKRDDAILAKLIGFLDHFSLINPRGTKVVNEKASIYNSPDRKDLE